MKKLLIVLFITALSTAAADKPNIIFVMADDLGYRDLGCYGQKLISTPSLDRMASEGMMFTSCYSGSTVCAPSRSVLMTGQHTGHTTVRGNMGKGGVKGLGGAKGRIPLKAEDVTIAEVLKKAGYVTGMAGKWGLGEPNTSGEPNEQGFDEFFGYLNQRRAHHYYVDYIWKNKEKHLLPGNKKTHGPFYTHDLFADFALDFIRKNKEKPFFLYLPYLIPHSAFEVPSQGIYKNKKWKENEKNFAAMVSRMDEDLGEMFDLLKKLNIDDKTIVFFCSDNGAAQRWEGLFNSSGELKGKKRSMYEGGTRVPMIVRWPGNIPAGKVSDAPWAFWDVLPTLADIAGLASPENVDGISVLPTLKGQKQDLADRFFYWEFFEGGYKQALRWRNWKAVIVKDNVEIYDLESDLGEKKNLAAKKPELVQEFKTYLKSCRTESEYWPLKR